MGSGCLECCVERILCHDPLVMSARSKVLEGSVGVRTAYTSLSRRLPHAQGTSVCCGPEISALSTKTFTF